jgi:hypothetical protein
MLGGPGETGSESAAHPAAPADPSARARRLRGSLAVRARCGRRPRRPAPGCGEWPRSFGSPRVRQRATLVEDAVPGGHRGAPRDSGNQVEVHHIRALKDLNPQGESNNPKGPRGWPHAAGRPLSSAAPATRTSTTAEARHGNRDKHWRVGCHRNRARQSTP